METSTWTGVGSSDKWSLPAEEGVIEAPGGFTLLARMFHNGLEVDYTRRGEESSMGKMQEIRELLGQGRTARELIDDGYPASSVYKGQAQLRKQSGERAGRTKTGRQNGNGPSARRDGRHGEENTEGPQQVDADPDVKELRKELTVARLEKQLADTKSSSHQTHHGLLTIEVDAPTLRLYHLVVAAGQRRDPNYRPTLGDWMREATFYFHWGHPGFANVAEHFSPEQHGVVDGHRCSC